jgi:cysteinyl-tRNA synthetase
MGYDPRAIRYLLLSTHYRQKLNFTFKGLEMAKNTVYSLIDFVDRLEETKSRAKWNEDLHRKAVKAREKFEAYMDDDLNIRKALATIFDLVKETNKAMDAGEASQENLREILDLMMEFDGILGVMKRKKRELPPEFKRLIEEREEARARKDFARADEIRAELYEKGVVLEDTPEGTRWRWKER